MIGTTVYAKNMKVGVIYSGNAGEFWLDSEGRYWFRGILFETIRVNPHPSSRFIVKGFANTKEGIKKTGRDNDEVWIMKEVSELSEVEVLRSQVKDMRKIIELLLDEKRITSRKMEHIEVCLDASLDMVSGNICGACYSKMEKGQVEEPNEV